MPSPRNIGIVYNPRVSEAKALATRLAEHVGIRDSCWVTTALEMDQAESRMSQTAMVIVLGGDGTILRVVRVAAPHQMPIVGVNLGRVGFMTELTASEALERIDEYLDGSKRMEERAMLQAEVVPEGLAGDTEERRGPPPFHALNDVVISRGAVPRVVHIETRVDGAPPITYTADGIIVATATGSTGYALATGGPIIYPQAQDILLTAIAPHISLDAPLILPSTSIIDLTVHTDSQAILSVDGFVDLALGDGDTIRVRRSPHMARFLRANPPSHFFATLTQRLRQVRGSEPPPRHTP